MSRLNFTKKVLDALDPAEPGKRVYLYDSGEPGLIISVTDRGQKSFYLYKKIQGKPERILIGPYPDITIEQARGRAAGLKSEIANGKNPADKRRLDRDEMTVGEFFDEYIERHSKDKKRTWKEDQQKFEQYLSSNIDGINL